MENNNILGFSNLDSGLDFDDSRSPSFREPMNISQAKAQAQENFRAEQMKEVKLDFKAQNNDFLCVPLQHGKMKGKHGVGCSTGKFSKASTDISPFGSSPKVSGFFAQTKQILERKKTPEFQEMSEFPDATFDDQASEYSDFETEEHEKALHPTVDILQELSFSSSSASSEMSYESHSTPRKVIPMSRVPVCRGVKQMKNPHVPFSKIIQNPEVRSSERYKMAFAEEYLDVKVQELLKARQESSVSSFL